MIRHVAGGVDLDVRVQPRASRNEICGVQGEALKVRLAAPPVDGEANEALVRFLAEAADVPRSSVRILRGHTGRTKTLRFEGVSPEQLRKAFGLEEQ